MVIILMGVAGAGKTTIGRLLARTIGWEFLDADDFHSPQNKQKMRDGVPLTDSDRRPWLARMRQLIATSLKDSRDIILRCSALKQAYRDLLVTDPRRVKLVYLEASKELIRQRLAHRAGHFFNKDLPQSLFDTLEEPRGVFTIDAARVPEEVVAAIRDRFRL